MFLDIGQDLGGERLDFGRSPALREGREDCDGFVKNLGLALDESTVEFRALEGA